MPWRGVEPQGLKAESRGYDPREGETYQMTFTYDEPGRVGPARPGEFLELVPDQRMVHRVHFESEDSAFQGP